MLGPLLGGGLPQRMTPAHKPWLLCSKAGNSTATTEIANPSNCYRGSGILESFSERYQCLIGLYINHAFLWIFVESYSELYTSATLFAQSLQRATQSSLR